jgi:uncharacterized tellurite resistance protein B-like protein
MIGAIKKLFEVPARETGEALQRRLHLTAAAMLIETARADFSEEGAEQLELEQLLCSSLALDKSEVRELLELATRQLDESTSLYDFTRVINDYYSPGQKLALIQAMWKVAYADGNLDKYEEHLIRQVAELTYVPHADYIRAKLAAKS